MQAGDGVIYQIADGGAGIDEFMHKRAVGTIFKQSANQIGQQIFVGTNRGIDAHIHAVIMIDHCVVKLFPMPCKRWNSNLRFALAASCWMQTTVWALWVANCGEISPLVCSINRYLAQAR